MNQDRKLTGYEVLGNLEMYCARMVLNLSETSVNLRVWTSVLVAFLNDLHSKRGYIQRALTLLSLIFSH